MVADGVRGLTQLSGLAERVEEARRRKNAPLVLELDLSEDLIQGPPQDPVNAIMARRRARLEDILEGLRRARSDSRVVGLVAKLGRSRMGLGTAQELRDAVVAFRETGKDAAVWAPTFGEFAPGTVPYFLASGFDRIYLQPSGDVGLTGVVMEARFLRDALAKAGIKPQLARRHEYKNAADVFLERGFTKPHREASSRIVASLAEQIASGIATGRGLSTQQVSGLIDRGLLMAGEAREAGLVDQLAYRDEVFDDVLLRARERSGQEARLLFVGRYLRSLVRKEAARQVTRRHEPKIALIHGFGPIRTGRSGRNPLVGATMGSDTVASAFRSAARDERVKAIVFRVNSPGGSYVASDMVWREVVRARASGKPVVVSMGDIAGSGGYYVAMAADVIVAEPATITGSIGVVGGKAVLSELLDRVGIGHDAVFEGEHARMFSSARGFEEGEWKRVNAWLDRIYDDFTAKVAEGRGLSKERVHELARGRIWTGADAKEHALADELGGLERAVDIARSKAGIPAGARAALHTYPKTTPLDQLRPPESSEDPAAAAATIIALDTWGPLATLATKAGLPVWGPLTMSADFF